MSVENIDNKHKKEDSNDWNDDDNDWDDWLDAEDNNQMTQSQTDSHKHSPTHHNGKDISISTNIKSNTDHTYNNNSDNNQSHYENGVTQTTSLEQKTTSWGGLFGGVVSSVLSTATEGLGNITSTVTQGLDKVIGVPDPTELARHNAIAKSKVMETQNTSENSESKKCMNNSNIDKIIEENKIVSSNTSVPVFGINLVSGVTNLGSKVINTGLDTLEGIGKKTMNILQENDPMLRDKIKKLTLEPEKPNLSAILQQAKEENEQLERHLKALKLQKMKTQLRFDVLFENNCGQAHLEALQILSQYYRLKIETLKTSLSGKALQEFLETLNEVQELMELDDTDFEAEKDDYSIDELNENFKQTIKDAEININFDEIINVWSLCIKELETEENINTDDMTQPQYIYSKGLTYLVETCALQMLKLHKIAEVLLIKEHHSTASEVDAIIQLCTQFIKHLQVITNRFAAKLSLLNEEEKQKDDVKTSVENLFAEMLVARQQIVNAFQLFLPILQIGTV